MQSRVKPLSIIGPGNGVVRSRKCDSVIKSSLKLPTVVGFAEKSMDELRRWREFYGAWHMGFKKSQECSVI